MHYGSKFFNRNGADTIRPKEFYRINPNVIGRLYYSHGGEVLSELDVLKANIMYKCNKVKGEFFRKLRNFLQQISIEKMIEIP